MAYLLITTSPREGEVCHLDKPKVVIGRHPDCDILMGTLDVSRHHAQVLCINNEWFLEDLHSTNGTEVNQQPVTCRCKLAEGDAIGVIDTVLEFHEALAPDSAPSEPSVSSVRVLVADGGQADELVVLSRRDAGPDREAVGEQGSSRSRASVEAELKALLKITRSLRKRLDLDQVLPHILDALFEIFPRADRGFIVLREDDGTLSSRWTKLRQADATQQICISRTVLTQVVESQQAVLTADALDDSRFKNSDSLSQSSVRSMMCAPLIDSADRSFGAVQVDATRGGRFNEEDLEVLLGVATQASIAIDNARLHARALEQHAVERDLELADRIQRSLLPASSPSVSGYRFYHCYRPATYVGGDFYDYVCLPNGQVAVLVADVSGHGLAAAMLTAKLAGLVQYRLLTAARPADAVRELNDRLAADLLDDHFITMALAQISPASGEVTLINAGHVPPLLVLGGEQVVELGRDHSGLPLGVNGHAEYGETTFELPRGGTLVMYTDGIAEAVNAAGESYGADRIRQRLAAGHGSAEELVHALVEDVRQFIEGCAQSDDMCLVCVSRE